MDSNITSLHHVTATVAEAQPDLDFYVGLLGQRLVKKTVNFDNPGVYHFYYGDERGTPGTIMTTFPYAGKGVREGVRGVGQVTVTSFSAPRAAMGFWRQRLRAHGVPFVDEGTAFGEEAITCSDPSGLVIRIVGTDGDARDPWTGAGITPAQAIRGIHSVSLLVREPATTIALVQSLLDGAVIDEGAHVTRMGINGRAPGQLVEIIRASDEAAAVNGLGTVHHVAFAATTDAAQLALREEIIARGVKVTPVLDRQYFHSIYFREPNGVLFEVATRPPGFTVDEPVGALGQALKLPPWEEPRRAQIESVLPAVHA
ncbi:MAG: ring-cleaving dioxygenase [Gemmatimonadetes bacterium]|nr:ring-cleaving dioxygenase [Gemmatimonadota bacterium]